MTQWSACGTYVLNGGHAEVVGSTPTTSKISLIFITSSARNYTERQTLKESSLASVEIRCAPFVVSSLMSSPPYNHHLLNRIKTPNTSRPRAASGASAVSFSTANNEHLQDKLTGVVLSPRTTDLWDEIGRVVVAMCAGEGLSTGSTHAGGAVLGGVEGVNALVRYSQKLQTSNWYFRNDLEG